MSQDEVGKPFSRELANSYAISRILSAKGDSLADAPKKSIMVQKETEASTLAQAQPANEPAKKGVGQEDFYRWSVTMAYSPQYSYAPVKIGNSSPMTEDVSLAQPQTYQQYKQAVEEYNDSYKPAYSYSASVGASYRINEKWQIESGVMYTQTEATTTHSYLIYGGGATAANMPGNFYSGAANRSTPLVANVLQTDASAQPLYVSPTDQYSTRYKYQQIGLPVRVAYRLNMKKAYALISGGINMNVLVQNSIMPETDQVQAIRYGLNDKDSPFRTMQWATSTSIGLGYDVTRKMSILVAPEFVYSLSPMVRENQQQANPYQLGVNIGGRWRLTK